MIFLAILVVTNFMGFNVEAQSELSPAIPCPLNCPCPRIECCPDEVQIIDYSNRCCCPKCVKKSQVVRPCCGRCNNVLCQPIQCSNSSVMIQPDRIYECCPRCISRPKYDECRRRNCVQMCAAVSVCPAISCEAASIIEQPDGEIECCPRCRPRKCRIGNCRGVVCLPQEVIRARCPCDTVFVPPDGDCNCCGMCVRILA